MHNNGGISASQTQSQLLRPSNHAPNATQQRGVKLGLPIMQGGRFARNNLEEGAANPYPLAKKPRDIQRNKRDIHIFENKYCVDTSPIQQA